MNNTIKKVVTILSLTVILFSSISFANAADVLTETDAANNLSSIWVIVDQSSNPDAYNLDISITRREMLKVMINLSLIKVWDTCTGKFADLQESDWGCKYAETALARGFIAPNTLFRPDDNVSKIEALKMILQARDISKNNSIEDWRAWYVDAAVTNGILSNAFTDYNTAWVRGWIFLVWANAVNATPGYTIEKIIYRASKDICGDIVYSEKLAADFDSAFAKFEIMKKAEFNKCPNDPCYDISLESKKVQELKDINGNIVDKVMYLIDVKDNDTNLPVTALSNAIDDEWNLYNINMCND